MSVDVTFDVSEMTVLAHDLVSLGGEAGALARTAVRVGTLATEADAKTYAPRDTGFLVNSIGSEFSGNAFYSEGVTGPTASYGDFVERGTSRMGPQPYMGPAHERQAPPFMQAIELIAGRAP